MQRTANCAKRADVSLQPLRDQIPATMTERRGEKLIGIQLGRAVAAILVVLYHGGRVLPQYVGPIDAAKYFTFGNAGVDFFFALSGFIIFYVHQQDINSPARLGHYLFRRTTRVYPFIGPSLCWRLGCWWRRETGRPFRRRMSSRPCFSFRRRGSGRS